MPGLFSKRQKLEVTTDHLQLALTSMMPSCIGRQYLKSEEWLKDGFGLDFGLGYFSSWKKVASDQEGAGGEAERRIDRRVDHGSRWD